MFLYLDIYKHNWYQTWMTVLGLIILFSVVRITYNKIFNRPGRILKYVLTILAVYVPHTILITWPLKLLGYPTFTTNVFSNQATSVMLLFAINFIALSNIITPAYFLKLKWWGNAIIILILCIAYYLAYIFNYIIYDSIGILVFFVTTQISGMYLSIFIVDRLYDQIGNG